MNAPEDLSAAERAFMINAFEIDILLEDPQLGIQVGDALLVKILDIDTVRRRITLSHRQAVSGL
ncbi:hypothetical protein OG393_21620 [Streptomyces sp. NBC_01216]|uniref:hypothetical protein n=1 Tax=Streptomyces sp. NBC_01216 TaxID=2903778 RepID=UPI002E0FAF16|nr:hypothetical protein OG393_21620 [Streptomyces sp. NBC_01216]